MSPKTNIFVTGATGYIGGAVLLRLLDHPSASTFAITALVRSPEKAEKLKGVGVEPVIGSHSDLALLEKLASEADVIIAMADADDFPAAKAILAGTKKRHETSGVPPILIHTSGTGVLADEAAGMYAYETVYNDADPNQMATLAPTQLHRNVDLELLEADKQGYVKTYIIMPSTIYGVATGRLVDLGISNPHSIQIPVLIKVSLNRGQGAMVGEGKNLWPNVQIEELADLFIVLYDAIVSNPATGHGLDGYYFGENGEHSLYQIGEAIGKVLVVLGKAKSPEPSTLTDEEIQKYFKGNKYLGSNSRCRADHSRSIGWKPVKTTKDMLASIRQETEALLKQEAQTTFEKL